MSRVGVRVAKGEVRSTITISIEDRPPRKGEYGWWVARDLPPDKAVEQIIKERGCAKSGILGFGWRAEYDYEPTRPDDEDRTVTIFVDEDAAIGAITLL